MSLPATAWLLLVLALAPPLILAVAFYLAQRKRTVPDAGKSAADG